MYHQPKVSIIIPCYNSEKFLNKAIDSAINQSLNKIEIILIDDGSTDKTHSLLQQYKMKDNRIILIEHPKNEGLALARNHGIEQATGEYIYFLDSDDYMHPNTLEVLYEQAKNEDLDILQSKYVLKKGNKKVILQEDFHPLPAPMDGITYFHQDFFVSPMACGKLFKTDFIKKNQIQFPDRYYEDMTFTFEAITLAKKIGHNLMPTYFYQLRDESISKNFGRKNLEDYQGVLTDLQAYFMNPLLTDKLSTFPVQYYLFMSRFSEEVIKKCNRQNRKKVKKFVENLAKKYKKFISTNQRYPFMKRMLLQASPYNYALLSLKFKKKKKLRDF